MKRLNDGRESRSGKKFKQSKHSTTANERHDDQFEENVRPKARAASSLSDRIQALSVTFPICLSELQGCSRIWIFENAQDSPKMIQSSIHGIDEAAEAEAEDDDYNNDDDNEDEDENDGDERGKDRGESLSDLGFEWTRVQVCDAKIVYEEIFKRLRQRALRQIVKAWLRRCHPQKQTTFPYNGNNASVSSDDSRNPGKHTAPDYWPNQDGWEEGQGCRHKEPDHVFKKERLVLAMHLLDAGSKFKDAQFCIEDMEDCTAKVLRDCAKDFCPGAEWLLRSLYCARRYEILSEQGQLEPQSFVSLPFPPKNTTKRTKNAGKFESAEVRSVNVNKEPLQVRMQSLARMCSVPAHEHVEATSSPAGDGSAGSREFKTQSSKGLFVETDLAPKLIPAKVEEFGKRLHPSPKPSFVPYTAFPPALMQSNLSRPDYCPLTDQFAEEQIIYNSTASRPVVHSDYMTMVASSPNLADIGFMSFPDYVPPAPTILDYPASPTGVIVPNAPLIYLDEGMFPNREASDVTTSYNPLFSPPNGYFLDDSQQCNAVAATSFFNDVAITECEPPAYTHMPQGEQSRYGSI